MLRGASSIRSFYSRALPRSSLGALQWIGYLVLTYAAVAHDGSISLRPTAWLHFLTIWNVSLREPTPEAVSRLPISQRRRRGSTGRRSFCSTLDTWTF